MADSCARKTVGIHSVSAPVRKMSFETNDLETDQLPACNNVIIAKAGNEHLSANRDFPPLFEYAADLGRVSAHA